METVEIVIYLFVALVLGGIVISIIAGIKPQEIYGKLRDSMLGKQEPRYVRIPSERLAAEAYRLWESCGFGAEEKNLTLYVESGPEVNDSLLFKTYVKLNLCGTIQSNTSGCGVRDDVDIAGGSVTPPALVTLRCDPSTRRLLLS